MPSPGPTAATNDVEKKVWQPLGFGDKGLSEALKRLKVEGTRPDCRCLRSAGATVAMSRPRLHAQLGFLALGVFLRLPSLQPLCISAPLGHSGASAGPATHTPLLPFPAAGLLSLPTLICALPIPACFLTSHSHTHTLTHTLTRNLALTFTLRPRPG